MRYEFPFHVFHRTDTMPDGVIGIEGFDSIEGASAQVRRLLACSGIQDMVLVRVQDATYQEVCGVVWPFQDMLRAKYGERLTHAEILPPVRPADAVREVA